MQLCLAWPSESVWTYWNDRKRVTFWHDSTASLQTPLTPFGSGEQPKMWKYQLNIIVISAAVTEKYIMRPSLSVTGLISSYLWVLVIITDIITAEIFRKINQRSVQGATITVNSSLCQLGRTHRILFLLSYCLNYQEHQLLGFSKPFLGWFQYSSNGVKETVFPPILWIHNICDWIYSRCSINWYRREVQCHGVPD